MESCNFISNTSQCLLMDSQLSPNPFYYDCVSSQQIYPSYNNTNDNLDYTYSPPFTNIVYENAEAFISYPSSAVSHSIELQNPSYIQNSSFSVCQSPSQQFDEILNDLSLDELFKVNDIDAERLIINEQLYDVLNETGWEDILGTVESSSIDVIDIYGDNSSTSSSSSIASTPKRKYSTDSTSDCFSLDSFETSSSIKTNKRVKRSKIKPLEKIKRKKDQNKKAATRYREKKKTELNSSEQTLEELELNHNNLLEKMKKLQTEFQVILPLAKAAFILDPIRREHLNKLVSRIDSLI